MVSLRKIGGISFKFRGGLEQRAVQTCAKLRFDFTPDARDKFLQFQESLSSFGTQNLQLPGDFFRAAAMDSEFFLQSVSHFRETGIRELLTLARIGLPEVIDSGERVPQGLLEARFNRCLRDVIRSLLQSVLKHGEEFGQSEGDVFTCR